MLFLSSAVLETSQWLTSGVSSSSAFEAAFGHRMEDIAEEEHLDEAWIAEEPQRALRTDWRRHCSQVNRERK